MSSIKDATGSFQTACPQSATLVVAVVIASGKTGALDAPSHERLLVTVAASR